MSGKTDESIYNLRIDMDKLRALSKELRTQTDTTVNQLNHLEHKLLEASLSLRSSDREAARLKQIEELSKEMGKLHTSLDPLNRRRALVDALLDPSTVFWFNLRMGDHKRIVEEAISDILQRDMEEDKADDPEGKTTTHGPVPKPGGEEKAGCQAGRGEEKAEQGLSGSEPAASPPPEDGKGTRKRRKAPGKPPSEPGFFDGLLED